MTEKYIIQPSGDQILMVEKETNTALYVKEVVKKLNEHAEMVEALKEIKKIAKRLNYWIGIDTIINPLINEIKS